MELTTVEARDLPEAWNLVLRAVMDTGHVYTIDRGSFQGQQRRELGSLTLRVKYPGTRPLCPDTPRGVPPPASQEYIEQYLPYLMTADKQQNEIYTYGEDIDRQLPELFKIYRDGGFGTNQACMSVGGPHSIFLEHSQCLRLIDTRVWNNELTFYVYFRSWDLWGGFPSNLAAIQMLKEYVAGELGVKDGEIIAYSKGCHLYDHNWSLANTVLGRS